MPLRASLTHPLWLLCATGLLVLAMGATAAEPIAPNGLKPHQAVSPGTPPQSPAIFDPDPNKLVLPTNRPPATNWSRSLTVSSNAPPASPPQFNPDPGAALRPLVSQPPPFFRSDPPPSAVTPAPLP